MPKGMETKLYPQRWVQLGYLAVLALLSDWVCFSVAAAPETWVQTYAHDPATLIDIFLFTNVFFCFAEPAIVRRVGLRNCIVGAAIVMSSGCALRSGIPLTGAVPSYPFVVAGTILVGAAQPFFQCTPPLLSATWFGAEERATATATAINFNQVGIAPEPEHQPRPSRQPSPSLTLTTQPSPSALPNPCPHQARALTLALTRDQLQPGRDRDGLLGRRRDGRLGLGLGIGLG